MYHFEEHDVIIPITVIEELDQFKKGNQTVNYHARKFTRNLDSISGDQLFNGGLPIGNGSGKISVQLEREFHPQLLLNFNQSKPDHHILNIAYHLAKEDLQRIFIIVSKDVNLRMKAKSVGLMAEDYTNDHVKNVATLYTGTAEVMEPDEIFISQLHSDGAAPLPAERRSEQKVLPNEYFIVKSAKKSALVRYNGKLDLCERIDKLEAFGVIPRNAEQTFALDALLNPDIPLVTIGGKAGTGKTLLALAAALERKKEYRQILLARPIVPLSNKDIGYLPGDIQSKLSPYMQPLYDNLNVIRSLSSPASSKQNCISKLLEDGKLVIEPLAYIRGRSLVKLYIIVDEAQNLTPHEVKTIITRAGEGSKIVFTGDVFQIDHPYLDSHSNGLSYLIEKMQGQPLYAHVTLRKGERSKLAELASDLL